MQLVEEIHLGWQTLPHADDCPNPVWDRVEQLLDTGAHHRSANAEQHACANPDCEHATTFPRLQLRLLCLDCHTVHQLAAESRGLTRTTSAATGWGQPPLEVGGVWLWPGRPVRPGGEVQDYLVTRERVAEVTAANVYGLITRYRDSEGTQRWIAGARPDEDGAHWVHSLRWRYRSAGLVDLDEAARWVATADRAHRPLVVAV